MKKFTIALLLSLAGLPALAQGLGIEEVREDKLLATANYIDVFHYEAPAHSKVPKGFKPVYLSTYTRHGARLFSKNTLYDNMNTLLETAHEQGQLTATGEEFYRRYTEFYPLVKGREYDLTTIGQAQHRRHAHRLYAEYKPLFKAGNRLDARSTQITRTILSMSAFTEEIKSISPKLIVTTSSSPVDMAALNPTTKYNPRAEHRDYTGTLEKADQPWQPDYRMLWEENTDPEGFMSRIFKDWKFVETVYPNVYEAQKMFYYVIADAQCATGGEGPFLEFATAEELYKWAECENFRIYCVAGMTDCYGHRPWALSELLLRDMLEYAERDLAGESMEGPYPDPVQVRMRYGHDYKIAALMTLLDIDGWNVFENDPHKVKDVYGVHNLPMASSFEWAFYRNREGVVLVKLVLNDKEIKLPIDSYSGPYYSWEDFKAYCGKRLAVAEEIILTK